MCAAGAMPASRAAAVVAVAGDDARDVRAVAVVVVGLRRAVHEVDERGDALVAADPDRRGCCRVGEVVVPGGDAGVDRPRRRCRRRRSRRLCCTVRAPTVAATVAIEPMVGRSSSIAQRRRDARASFLSMPVRQLDDQPVDQRADGGRAARRACELGAASAPGLSVTMTRDQPARGRRGRSAPDRACGVLARRGRRRSGQLTSEQPRRATPARKRLRLCRHGFLPFKAQFRDRQTDAVGTPRVQQFISQPSR